MKQATNHIKSYINKYIGRKKEVLEMKLFDNITSDMAATRVNEISRRFENETGYYYGTFDENFSLARVMKHMALNGYGLPTDEAINKAFCVVKDNYDKLDDPCKNYGEYADNVLHIFFDIFDGKDSSINREHMAFIQYCSACDNDAISTLWEISVYKTVSQLMHSCGLAL